MCRHSSELQINYISKLSFTLPFFKRFVEDIVRSISEDQVDNLFNVFNNYHYKIQFTIELEKKMLTVLGFESYKSTDNNIIWTDLYQKSTCARGYLNFNSKHLMQQTMNIIQNLKNGISKLSHPEFHTQNIVKIIFCLKKNDSKNTQ